MHAEGRVPIAGRALLRWVAVPESADPAPVARILDLDADPIRIIKVEFLGVATMNNLSIEALGAELGQRALRVKVIDGETDVIDTGAPSIPGPSFEASPRPGGPARPSPSGAWLVARHTQAGMLADGAIRSSRP